jgi:hypothetical protein
MEKYFKKIQGLNRKIMEPSVADPKRYYERFISFISKIFDINTRYSTQDEVKEEDD